MATFVKHWLVGDKEMYQVLTEANPTAGDGETILSVAADGQVGIVKGTGASTTSGININSATQLPYNVSVSSSRMSAPSNARTINSSRSLNNNQRKEDDIDKETAIKAKDIFKELVPDDRNKVFDKYITPNLIILNNEGRGTVITTQSIKDMRSQFNQAAQLDVFYEQYLRINEHVLANDIMFIINKILTSSPIFPLTSIALTNYYTKKVNELYSMLNTDQKRLVYGIAVPAIISSIPNNAPIEKDLNADALLWLSELKNKTILLAKRITRNMRLIIADNILAQFRVKNPVVTIIKGYTSNYEQELEDIVEILSELVGSVTDDAKIEEWQELIINLEDYMGELKYLYENPVIASPVNKADPVKSCIYIESLYNNLAGIIGILKKILFSPLPSDAYLDHFRKAYDTAGVEIPDDNWPQKAISVKPIFPSPAADTALTTLQKKLIDNISLEKTIIPSVISSNAYNAFTTSKSFTSFTEQINNIKTPMTNGLNVNNLIIESIFKRFLISPTVIDDAVFGEIDEGGNKKVKLSTKILAVATINAEIKKTKNIIYKKANIALQSRSDEEYMKYVYENMPDFKYMRKIIRLAADNSNFNVKANKLTPSAIEDAIEAYSDIHPKSANNDEKFIEEQLINQITNIKSYINSTTSEKEKKKILNKIENPDLKAMLKMYNFNDILTNLPDSPFASLTPPPPATPYNRPKLPELHRRLLHFLSLTLLNTPSSYPPDVYSNPYFTPFFEDQAIYSGVRTKLIDREDLDDEYFKGFLEAIGHYITINNAKSKFELGKLIDYAYGIDKKQLEFIANAGLPSDVAEREFWDWAAPQEGGQLYLKKRQLKLTRRASKRVQRTRRR